jgi:arylsulfatase A-like enzyme
MALAGPDEWARHASITGETCHEAQQSARRQLAGPIDGVLCPRPTDDVGFAAPSTFGGVIPTPALDRIAADGLRYTNLHSTSLCSPMRATLITDRNHHSVGFGVISEAATGFPGYDSVIGKDNATIGRILLDNGYRTSWFGTETRSQLSTFTAFAALNTDHYQFHQWARDHRFPLSNRDRA